MPTRPVLVERGRARGREAVAALARELREARLDRGLSQAAVARAVGVDRSWVSLVERGAVSRLDIIQLSELLAAVGLELAARTYPAPGAVRDAAHVALLRRLRAVLHPALGWATEVPLPGVGELRAWDAVVSSGRWQIGVEAETRPRDLQALERRLALKERDGDVDGLLLVLLDSRRNRRLMHENADVLAPRFPVAGRRALERLRAGLDPGGSAIVFLSSASGGRTGRASGCGRGRRGATARRESDAHS